MSKESTYGDSQLPAVADMRERIQSHAQRGIDALPETLTMDEAEPFIRYYNSLSEVGQDLDWIARFVLGEATRRIRAGTPHGEVGAMLDEVGQRFDIHPRTIRYAMGCAEAFNGNLTMFVRWLDSGDFQKRWHHIKTIVRKKVDVRELGIGSLNEEITRKVEGAAEDLEQINDEADKRDAEGAAQQLVTEADRYRQQSKNARAEQKEDVALSHFDRWLAELDCAGCGKPAEPGQDEHRSIRKNDPHHLAPSATAQKQSEWAKVPLCRECHTRIHKGYTAFKEETGVDVRYALADVLHRWISDGERLRLPAGLEGHYENPAPSDDLESLLERHSEALNGEPPTMRGTPLPKSVRAVWDELDAAAKAALKETVEATPQPDQ
jgi:hypothetical protein